LLNLQQTLATPDDNLAVGGGDAGLSMNSLAGGLLLLRFGGAIRGAQRGGVVLHNDRGKRIVLSQGRAGDFYGLSMNGLCLLRPAARVVVGSQVT
jgi:hypothetical protein